MDHNLFLRSFKELCEKYGMTHERIPVRTPNMNAHIESFHSILERECYTIHEFISFAEAYREIDAFIRLYNERRKHSSLGYKSPGQFYKNFLEESLKTQRYCGINSGLRVPNRFLLIIRSYHC